MGANANRRQPLATVSPTKPDSEPGDNYGGLIVCGPKSVLRCCSMSSSSHSTASLLSGAAGHSREKGNKRSLAIRILRREVSSNPEPVARFLQERARLTSIPHSNVVWTSKRSPSSERRRRAG